MVEITTKVLRYRTGYGRARGRPPRLDGPRPVTHDPKFDGPRKRCVAAMLAGDMQAYGEACAELRGLLAPKTKPDGRKVDHGLDRL